MKQGYFLFMGLLIIKEIFLLKVHLRESRIKRKAKNKNYAYKIFCQNWVMVWA